MQRCRSTTRLFSCSTTKVYIVYKNTSLKQQLFPLTKLLVWAVIEVMIQRRTLLIILLLFFSSLALDARDAILARLSYQLPVHASIGQVVQVQQGSAEEKTMQALESAYSQVWVDGYVPASLRQAFVYTYDSLLVSLLPVKEVQIGKAVKRDVLFEVPFAVYQPSYRTGTMIWTPDEAGDWVLLSLTVSQ